MTKADAAKKVKEFLRERRKGSAAFRKSGEILDELVAEVGVGVPIDCGRAGSFQIADNYARKNTQFKQVGFDRYCVESVDAG